MGNMCLDIHIITTNHGRYTVFFSLYFFLYRVVLIIHNCKNHCMRQWAIIEHLAPLNPALGSGQEK